jgi:hypothetical protein
MNAEGQGQIHGALQRAGIVPTMDASKAYRVGYNQAERELRSERDSLGQKVARLEQLMTEIGLLARRR